MKKRILYSLGLFLFFTDLLSQEVEFNNTHQALVYMNPSFAGSNGYIRNQTVYRNQWPNLSGNYVFYNTCFDAYIKPMKGGVSISAYSNDIERGLIRQNKISLAYAQYFTLSNSETTIIPSAQLTYGISTLDKAKLNWGTTYPYYGLPAAWSVMPSSKVSYFDLSTGIVVSRWGSYFGAALFNILEPNISFAGTYKLPMRGVIHASSNIAFNRRSKANMFIAYTMQGSNSVLNLRILNTFDNVLLWGLGYKVYFGTDPKVVGIVTGPNNVSFYLGLRRKIFTVNYSYDLEPSKLSGNTAGSHELSISISLKRKDEERKLRDLENK